MKPYSPYPERKAGEAPSTMVGKIQQFHSIPFHSPQANFTTQTRRKLTSSWLSRDHMLNIVTVSGNKYILDVGFGSSGPTHPLPLKEKQILTNVGSQQMRLLHGPIPDFTQSSQHLWQYEHRNGTDQPWVPSYAFSEMEFTPSDFEMMNYFTSSHRTSWFTYFVVCVKMVMEDGEIVGDVTLFGSEVKRRIRGKSELLCLCSSEEERVKALDELLGVKLSLAEVSGIRGMPTELAN